MRHLEIYNFGPIRKVSLDLARVNVFIGPQSAGKSCILKIACHCAWTEKRLMMSHDVAFFQKDNYFFNQLLSFHKLEGYDTDPDLRIVYRTSCLTLEYIHATKSFTCRFTRYENRYKRSKLSYIPAERDIIAAVPNWIDISFGDTNLRSFLSDWAEARKEFTTKYLPIECVGASYKYDDKTDTDMVKFADMPSSIPLRNASSGVQSITPMLLYVHYLTESVFSSKSASVTMTLDSKRVMARLYRTYENLHVTAKGAKIYQLQLNSEFLPFDSEEHKNEFLERYNNYTRYQQSDIFLEEPEENLFPLAQTEVVYTMLRSVMDTEHKNSIFIATHSPYVLYALNNMIAFNLVRKKMPDDERNTYLCATAEFNPNEVRVWQIENGEVCPGTNSPTNTIQDKSGLIRRNYFDSIMGTVMTEFSNLISYR